MLSARLFFAAIFLIGMAVTMIGCGESGSEPAVVPEIRLDVMEEAPNASGSPTGPTPTTAVNASGSPTAPTPTPTPAPAEFTITQLVAGVVSYQSLAGRTLRAPLAIFLENALSPLSATLEQTPSQLAARTIRVSALLLGGEGVGSVSSSEQNPITVVLGAVSPTPQGVAQPEVRFELCAPVAGASGCSIVDEIKSGSQLEVTGSVGDAFSTRLFGQASTTGDPPVRTPLVIFFQNPRFEIAGVFRSTNGAQLQAQLFVDGELRDTASKGGGDVVVRSDL